MTVAPVNLFQNKNVSAGIAAGASSPFQVGVNDVDNTFGQEKGSGLPWVIDKTASFLNFSCHIEFVLDPGTALHKPLPQNPQRVDSLSSAFIDNANYAQAITGVNLKSLNKYADVIQQMATSEYRFILRGFGVRAGYQVPIPALEKIAGIKAVPTFPQNVLGPLLVGNLSGIPLWLARWELHYILELPPKEQQLAPQNPALQVRADQDLPQQIQVPYSGPDSNAVPGSPGITVQQPQQFVIQKNQGGP